MNKKEIKAIISEHLTKKHHDKRYVIIDIESNEVLDNNNNEGYKSENKALASWALKHGLKPTRKDAKKRLKH